jgi:hypothetical protein
VGFLLSFKKKKKKSNLMLTSVSLHWIFLSWLHYPSYRLNITYLRSIPYSDNWSSFCKVPSNISLFVTSLIALFTCWICLLHWKPLGKVGFSIILSFRKSRMRARTFNLELYNTSWHLSPSVSASASPGHLYNALLCNKYLPMYLTTPHVSFPRSENSFVH